VGTSPFVPLRSAQAVGRNGAGPRSHQGVVGDGVHEVSVKAEDDRAAGEGESDLVAASGQVDDSVAVDLALDLDGSPAARMAVPLRAPAGPAVRVRDRPGGRRSAWSGRRCPPAGAGTGP
jgi:hypothetical protein